MLSISNIAQQFYCEQKLDMESEVPMPPTEQMKLGGTAHEAAATIGLEVSKEQSISDAVKEREEAIFICEFKIAWIHNGIPIIGWLTKHCSGEGTSIWWWNASSAIPYPCIALTMYRLNSIAWVWARWDLLTNPQITGLLYLSEAVMNARNFWIGRARYLLLMGQISTVIKVRRRHLPIHSIKRESSEI
jgi:hypothetical protein